MRVTEKIAQLMELMQEVSDQVESYEAEAKRLGPEEEIRWERDYKQVTDAYEAVESLTNWRYRPY